VKQETNRGKIKKHVEQYMTLASGVTEAEAKVVKNFEDVGDIREYRIKSAIETKVLEIV
jgi:hypothetical protein